MTGVYMVSRGSGAPLGVFKPCSEDVGCALNPKGYELGLVREGIRPGESPFREVAASMLDYKKFTGVPPTCFARLDIGRATPQLGSFQQYVKDCFPSSDFGPSLFPASDVQRIALFDIRTMNLDRHDGNILVRTRSDGVHELVPIDHGCILPERMGVCDFEWCWLNWPQTKQPLSPELIAHVNALDSARDEETLKDLNIHPQAMQVLAIMTLVLKLFVAAGMSLYQVATFVCRKSPKVLSGLERLVVKCKWQAAMRCSGKGGKAFRDVFIAVLTRAVKAHVTSL